MFFLQCFLFSGQLLQFIEYQTGLMASIIETILALAFAFVVQAQFNFSSPYKTFTQPLLFVDFVTSHGQWSSVYAGQQLFICNFLDSNQLIILDRQYNQIQSYSLDSGFSDLIVYQNDRTNVAFQTNNPKKICLFSIAQIDKIRCRNINYIAKKILFLDQKQIIIATADQITKILLQNSNAIKSISLQKFQIQSIFYSIFKNSSSEKISGFSVFKDSSSFRFIDIENRQANINSTDLFANYQISKSVSIKQSRDLQLLELANGSKLIFDPHSQSFKAIYTERGLFSDDAATFSDSIYNNLTRQIYVSYSSLITVIKEQMRFPDAYRQTKILNQFPQEYQNLTFNFRKNNSNIFGFFVGKSQLFILKQNNVNLQNQYQQNNSVSQNGTDSQNQTYTIANIQEISIIPQQVQIVNKVLTNALSVPNIRTAFKFMIPIMNVIDDYWAYPYHQANFSETNRVFLRSAKIIQDQPQIPSFIGIQKIYESMNLTKILKHNRYNYSPANYCFQQGHEFFFLQSIQDVYMFNYLINIIMIAFFRLAYILFRIKTCNDCNKSIEQQNICCFQKIKRYFLQKSVLVTFIASIIQGNIAFVSFNFGLQIMYHYQFGFEDKVNLIFTHIYGFTIVVYSFCFYPLVNKFQGTEVNHLFLGKEQLFYSLINQNSIQVFRLMLYGIIHGYFFNQTLTAISIVLGVKVFLIGLTFYSKRTNKNFYVFLLISLYYFVGILIDAQLLAQKWNSECILIIQALKIDWILIGSLLGIVILRFLLDLITDIRQIFIKQTNKVQDQPINKKKKESLQQRTNLFSLGLNQVVKNDQSGAELISSALNKQNQLQQKDNIMEFPEKYRTNLKAVSQPGITEKLAIEFVESGISKQMIRNSQKRKVKKPLLDQFLEHRRFLAVTSQTKQEKIEGNFINGFKY